MHLPLLWSPASESASNLSPRVNGSRVRRHRATDLTLSDFTLVPRNRKKSCGVAQQRNQYTNCHNEHFIVVYAYDWKILILLHKNNQCCENRIKVARCVVNRSKVILTDN